MASDVDPKFLADSDLRELRQAGDETIEVLFALCAVQHLGEVYSADRSPVIDKGPPQVRITASQKIDQDARLDEDHRTLADRNSLRALGSTTFLPGSAKKSL